MARIIGMLSVSLVALAVGVTPVGAISSQPHRPGLDWNRHDTAVYVVSTLNLLHSHSGRSLASAVTQKLDVTHFDVYADLNSSDLYFIQLSRDDGSTAATLAYRMGWLKPMSLSSSLDRFRVRRAPSDVGKAYRTDSKQLLASFTSTLPS